MGLMVDDQRRESVRLRPLQPRRVRTVRDDENDFCRIVGGTRCGGKRLHIRAAAGDQNGGALFRGHGAHLARATTDARVRSRPQTKGLVDWPADQFARLAPPAQGKIADGRYQSPFEANPNRPSYFTAHASPLPLASDFSPVGGMTSPMPQLNVRSISASSRLPVFASQPNTADASNDERSIRAAASFGMTRGRFSERPPPVMCDSAFMAPFDPDPPVARIAARTGLT